MEVNLGNFARDTKTYRRSNKTFWEAKKIKIFFKREIIILGIMLALRHLYKIENLTEYLGGAQIYARLFLRLMEVLIKFIMLLFIA